MRKSSSSLDVNHMFDLVRELERENATLKLQLELAKAQPRASVLLPAAPPIPVGSQMALPNVTPALPMRRKPGARYIEGVAYTVNPGQAYRNRNGKEYKVHVEPMRIFPNEDMVQAFLAERSRVHPGNFKRVGACIIEDEREE